MRIIAFAMPRYTAPVFSNRVLRPRVFKPSAAVAAPPGGPRLRGSPAAVAGKGTRGWPRLGERRKAKETGLKDGLAADLFQQQRSASDNRVVKWPELCWTHPGHRQVEVTGDVEQSQLVHVGQVIRHVIWRVLFAATVDGWSGGNSRSPSRPLLHSHCSAGRAPRRHS